jgi:protein-S-isoprenylcysteine O-methyltransferase Ste14
MPESQLVKIAAGRFLLGILTLMAVFFLPAGTFMYGYAWVYMGVLFLPLIFVLSYLLKNNPDLLERRMRTNEREKKQQIFVFISGILITLAYVLPGFDFRLGWSQVPVWVALLADLIVLAGYGFVFLVFRENRYTSRVVEVETEQTVIDTGPYAIVRHPMYLGMVAMYVFSPLALGSYWAMIPAILIIPALMFRLLDEEKVLERDLAGYSDYMKKVKHHLFPGIW